MKYELGQVVYYLEDNRVHSAPVLSRQQIDNLHEDWVANPSQAEAWARFGNAGILYATVHGNYNEAQLFASREELAASL